MTPLNKEQRQSIIERLNFMEVELSDLEKKYKLLTWQEYSTVRDVRRNVERIIENLANAVIDISKIYLAGEQIEMPGTYQEIVLKLGETGLISDKLASDLSQLTKARNVLAHQYLDLKWELIKNTIKTAPAAIKALIRKLG
ncbi:MAG: DUF86 domain-containing protein [Pseudomonadota bacterium]